MINLSNYFLTIQWQIQDFPWGGMDPLVGRGPLTQALFAKNVCKNKRIGSHRGACAGHDPPRSANAIMCTIRNFTTLSPLFAGVTAHLTIMTFIFHLMEHQMKH